MRTEKYHLYLDGNERTSHGYGKTACGRDGYKVGGLVPFFFKMGDIDSDSCKTCAKIFRRLPDETHLA